MWDALEAVMRGKLQAKTVSIRRAKEEVSSKEKEAEELKRRHTVKELKKYKGRI